MYGGRIAHHGRRVNIISPLLERNGDKVFNSTVWHDRNGRVLGTYRKVFPTDGEMAEGISPGSLDFSAFGTEFGKIGCRICFDLNFREVIEHIAEQDARVVIFPTMFQGIYLMQAWAKLYGINFVSVCDWLYASAVNALGVVTVAPWSHGPIVNVTLNLDYVVLHTDHNGASNHDKAVGAQKSPHFPLRMSTFSEKGDIIQLIDVGQVGLDSAIHR